MVNVSDYIFSQLASLGIKHVFMLPGGGAMHLNDALKRNKSIEGVICQHEQACGISAEAYGRLGSEKDPKFGVCLVTSGPGSTNALTPVSGAWIDSIPMLVISGQAKTNDLNQGKLRQSGVQEVNIIEMVKSITKYCVQIKDHKSIHIELEKSIKSMLSGRKGPSWIDIPLDIQAKTINDSRQISVLSETRFDYNKIHIKNSIKNSKRPLVLAGHGVRLAGATVLFKNWISDHKIPVVTTWNALDLLSFNNDLNIGRPGVVANRAANISIQNADLIIVLGARMDNVVTAYNLADFGRLATKIVVDIDEEELSNKSQIANLFLIRDDIKSFLKKFRDYRFESIDPEWQTRCLKLKNRFLEDDGSQITSKKKKISHSEFVDSVSELIPKDSLIATGSSGLAIEFLYARFKNKENQRIFLTSGLGSMGYGLSQAVGISFARAKSTVFAFESDGSLMLNIQELATVKSYQLPIKLFIMNNGGYASIRNTQTNYFSKRFIGVDKDSGLFIPSFRDISIAFGLEYYCINSIKDLTDAFTKDKTQKRPAIFDVFLEQTDILEPKSKAMIHDDGSITSMPLEDLSPLLDLDELNSLLEGNISKASIEARLKK